jgi:hypothetical protein
VELLPVVVLRLLDGRVGSTLLMQLLATSDQVALERRYPEGEYRYLSYCLRFATWINTPWDPSVHPGVTDLLFGPAELGGPIPFRTDLVDRARLAPLALRHLWIAMSTELLGSNPRAVCYAEKLVGPIDLLVAAGIPLKVIDCVRDPRDIFCSIRAFSGGGPGFGRLQGQSEDEFLEQMIIAQRTQLDAMGRHPSGVDRLSVRYEDFAPNLEEYAGIIGTWLGVGVSAETVIAAHSKYRHHMSTTSVEESIGRWRREMTTAQSNRVWSVLGGRLAALGYQQD